MPSLAERNMAAFIGLAVQEHRRILPRCLTLFPTLIIVNRNLRCPYEWLDPAVFRIRHYRSKSLEEYVQRRTGADAAYHGKQYTREQLALEWEDTNSRCGREATTSNR